MLVPKSSFIAVLPISLNFSDKFISLFILFCEQYYQNIILNYCIIVKLTYIQKTMFQPSKNLEIGNYATAKDWIESSKLDADTKLSILNFIKQMPEAPFYRYTSAAFETWTGPEWLKQIWMTFAFVWPEKIVEVKLKSKYDEEADWYQLYLGKCLMDLSSNSFNKQLRELGLETTMIGENREDFGEWVFVDNTSPNIYTLHDDDLSWFVDNNKPIKDAPGSIYDNYSMMLDNVSEIREITNKGKEVTLFTRAEDSD
jgi:hypothetical protein